jgi:hypothetical protein
MNKLDKSGKTKGPDEYMEVAKNALVFALMFIVLTIALWGYVYLILLERGMTQ